MVDIVGRTIEEVRPMTAQELVEEDWAHYLEPGTPVLVLDDGTRLYPSRDDEGNGPGALFGQSGTNAFRVLIKTVKEGR